MDEITTKALNTFNANMKYFEQNHKKVFEQLSLLNQVIETGIYTEKYALEYKEEGYFDVLELETNEFLYKSNSLEAAQRMVDAIDLKRTGAIFKAQKHVFATDEQAEAIDKSKLSFHNSLWATIKIINYVSLHASIETYMNRVFKIIFLGTGLGLHLPQIIKKMTPMVIFIKEKNLEIFRLSLFVTNYQELSSHGYLYFSLTDNEIEEKDNFIEFLDKGNNYNLNLKHIPFTTDYPLELQRLQSHVLSQSYINYGYSAKLLRYIDSPRYLARGYFFLNVNKIHKDSSIANKPILLLFSGPSTAKNIEWVKEHRDRFIIVSALSTCRLLSHNNIKPNIVIHIDPGENTALLFDGLDYQEYFKNTIIILSSNVDESTVQKLSHAPTYFVEQGTQYKKGFGMLSAPSVGEYTYALLLILGASKLFLLGIDLALDSETYESHGGFHAFQTKGEYNEQDASYDPTTSIDFTKGNFLDRVPLLPPHKLSIEQIEAFSQRLKRDYHEVYNLSNGAFLPGCEPLHFKDYDWTQLEHLDQNDIQQQIQTLFNTIGSNNFNEDDKGQLRYQIQTARDLEKVIKHFKKKKFAHVQAYLNALSQLFWDLSDMEYKTHSDLAEVYYDYAPIIQSYIFDLFNTRELANPNKHITNINTILITQLLKISNVYISALERYLK